MNKITKFYKLILKEPKYTPKKEVNPSSEEASPEDKILKTNTKCKFILLLLRLNYNQMIINKDMFDDSIRMDFLFDFKSYLFS